MRGIDYAWAPHPPAGLIKAAGFGFVMRYLSPDASKNLTSGELASLRSAGLSVGTVWEGGAQAMTGGHNAGVADAQAAKYQLHTLAMNGAFVYFAADWDATPAQQAAINAYLDGAATILGPHNVGIYGGYWPVSRALNAGKAAKAWQTAAWSGGNWDARAAIRQGPGISVAGVSVDVNDSMTADFGQWPRPVTPPPPAPKGPYRHVADGTKSLAEIAAARNYNAASLLAQSVAHYSAADIQAIAALKLPAGFPYYTLNP